MNLFLHKVPSGSRNPQTRYLDHNGPVLFLESRPPTLDVPLVSFSSTRPSYHSLRWPTLGNRPSCVVWVEGGLTPRCRYFSKRFKEVSTQGRLVIFVLLLIVDHGVYSTVETSVGPPRHHPRSPSRCSPPATVGTQTEPGCVTGVTWGVRQEGRASR